MSPRKRCDSRFERLKTERSSFMSHWQDMSRFTEPRLGRFIQGRDTAKGTKKNQHIIDSTAMYALRTGGSGMLYGMSSPSRPWFRLTLEDYELAQFAPVKDWLQICQQRLLDLFRKSNLYSVLPRIYREEMLFGTSAMFMGPHPEKLFWFYPYTIGSYCIANNEYGQVNLLYRNANMTVGNMAREFGKANLSKAACAVLDKNPDAYVPVVHCIEQNDSPVGGGNQAMPYRSIWYEEGADGEQLLKNSGYEEFPCMAPRWETEDEDAYGSPCPGMDALGDNKQLQHQQRQKGKNIDKIGDPPMQAPSTLKNKRVSQIPGEVTFYDTAQGGVRFEPAVIVPPGVIGELREDIREVQARIKRAFYEDLFLMITEMEGVQPRNNLEIFERKEEKMLVLGPVVENNNNDLHNPMIERAFNMAMRQSMPIWQGKVLGRPILPPPPKELRDMDIRIEQISMLAQAQKAVGTAAMEQTIAYAANLAAATQDPAAMDNINVDKAINLYADAKGAPADLLFGPDEVAEKRQARADQQAQMQRMAAMESMAKAAGQVGGIPADENSMVGKLMQSAQAQGAV